MAGVGIVRLAELLTREGGVIDAYGGKVRGNVRLLRLREKLDQEAAVAQSAGSRKVLMPQFLVQDGWGIPTQAQGYFLEGDLRQVFNSLIDGQRKHASGVRFGGLMVRSSAVEEVPGRYPTLSTPYDLLDIDGSYRRFKVAVDQVRGTHRDMGVLVSTMVGGPGQLDGRWVIGWNNTGFVADTHHPIKPDEMLIAAVHGLGSHAVTAGHDATLVSVAREIPWITAFLNRSDVAAMGGLVPSMPVTKERDYRQTMMDVLDVEGGDVRTLPFQRPAWTEITLGSWVAFAMAQWATLENGMLIDAFGREMRASLDERFVPGEYERLSRFNRKFGRAPDDRERLQSVGLNPFFPSQGLANLIGILMFLSQEVGPVQVEGVFEGTNSHLCVCPHLVQLEEMPPPERSDRPLQVRDDLTSSEVIGAGAFDGPLVWVRGNVPPQVLEVLDARFARTGYIHLAERQEQPLISATPHAHIRLSFGPEVPTDHSVTLIRSALHRNPQAGHILGSRVRLAGSSSSDLAGLHERGTIGDVAADERHTDVLVFNRVRVDSNGSQLAVEVLK